MFHPGRVFICSRFIGIDKIICGVKALSENAKPQGFRKKCES